MKKTLLLCFVLLLSRALVAQDVCAELMKFNDYQKNNNRTSRVTTKMESMGQTQVMERDKNGNIRHSMNMEMAGQTMKMDMIIVDKKLFVKKNGEDWATQPMDSVQMESMKNQWQNNQLQFFKNCQKLENEKLDNKNYRVYVGEFDAEKMLEMMGKSDQIKQNAEMIKKMEMKMTFYINDKDDAERVKMKMDMMGQSFDMLMEYEYDVAIEAIVAPIVEKKD